MTDPKVFKELENLVDLGIAKSFVEFIAYSLIANKVKEADVLQYCEEVKCRFESRKIARPRHLFSSVSSRRSSRKTPFWYK